MRPFVYIILLALVIIVVKAFFLDDYLAKKKLSESNATEVNTSSTYSFTKPVPQLKTRGVYGGEQNITIKKQKPAYSDMPLEKVGDEIADKLEDKL